LGEFHPNARWIRERIQFALFLNEIGFENVKDSGVVLAQEGSSCWKEFEGVVVIVDRTCEISFILYELYMGLITWRVIALK